MRPSIRYKSNTHNGPATLAGKIIRAQWSFPFCPPRQPCGQGLQKPRRKPTRKITARFCGIITRQHRRPPGFHRGGGATNLVSDAQKKRRTEILRIILFLESVKRKSTEQTTRNQRQRCPLLSRLARVPQSPGSCLCVSLNFDELAVRTGRSMRPIHANASVSPGKNTGPLFKGR